MHAGLGLSLVARGDRVPYLLWTLWMGWTWEFSPASEGLVLVEMAAWFCLVAASLTEEWQLHF